MGLEQIQQKILELKNEIEIEVMQYDIAEENPTYTEQFRRAQGRHLEKIQGLKRELRSLEDQLPCEKCGGEGVIEILGDGENFECDVIGHKPCPDCND